MGILQPATQPCLPLIENNNHIDKKKTISKIEINNYND